MTDYLAMLAVLAVFAGLFWVLPRVLRNDDATHGGGLDAEPTGATPTND